MAQDTKKQDLVFPVSGDMIITRFNDDGVTLDFTDPDKNYSTVNQVVESFSLGVSTETKELLSGNSTLPRKIYVNKLNGDVSSKLNAYDPQLYAMVTGGTFTKSKTNQQMWTTKSFTIPAETAYTIALPTGAILSTVSVKDTYGNSFDKTADSPAAGLYTIAEATSIVTLTFAAADAGIALQITYAYTASSVMAMEMEKTMVIPSYHIRMFGKATDVDQTQTFNTNYVFDKVSVDGDLKPPDLKNDPTGGWTVKFKMLEPRTGYKAFSQFFEKVS